MMTSWRFRERLLLVAATFFLLPSIVYAAHDWESGLPFPELVKKFPGPASYPRSGPGQDINTNKTRVFIASALRDVEELIKTSWADSVLDLIQLLGPDNTYLSIYERGSIDNTVNLLQSFKQRVPCQSSITSGTRPRDPARPDVPEKCIDQPPTRRIEYMAAIRNNALRPFYHEAQQERPYDRILWLNDIVFDPKEVASLILDTNGGSYTAACALDFKDPFTTYDTFSLRDFNFRPVFEAWFPFFEKGLSRSEVLKGKRDVHVSSCWGGAISFNAQPFYERKGNLTFRSSNSERWEASEACLLHADLDNSTNTFINTDVRVAYDPWTFSWLPSARYLEKPIYWLKTVLGFYRRQSWYHKWATKVFVFTTVKLDQKAVPFEEQVPMVISDEVGEFCGWHLLMFLGPYDPSTASRLGGQKMDEDRQPGSYWTLAIDPNQENLSSASTETTRKSDEL